MDSSLEEVPGPATPGTAASPAPLGRAAAARYAAWYRALSDPSRIQLVSLLASHGPMTVGQLAETVRLSQSTVSQHLKVLGEVRFVLCERRGTAHLYRLNHACVASFPAAAHLVVGRGLAGTAQPARAAGVLIRPMQAADATRVLAICQAGLDTGQASFETTAPGWPEFDAAKLPAHRFVAADAANGAVLGWTAASAVSGLCVCAGVIEHSVYVDPGARRRGVGAALLRALIGSAEAAGIWTIQSGIFPENTASLRLHEQAGFRMVGTRERIGRYRGRWRDVVLVERRSAVVGTG